MSDEIMPWSRDQMNRKGVAKFLTKYIDDAEKIKVLNINSAWGSGKTFFLQNWMAQEKNERVCIYFNAWETDFTGDAFVSLVAAIKEQLTKLIPLEEEKGAIRRFTKMASKTLLAATPALAKGVIKKATGLELGAIQEIIDSDGLADAAEKAIEKLIDSNKDSLDSIKNFKTTFHRLITLASEVISDTSNSKPSYIFIDELDRCRPTFAIELLERIKHLFDVDDCKFIIATDTPQLSHAIRAVYGSGFASEKYLKRFFDAEFTLDNSDTDAWVKANFFLPQTVQVSELGLRLNYEHMYSRMTQSDYRPDMDTILSGKHQLNQSQIIFSALAQTFGCKLRELEKIANQILAVASNRDTGEFHLFWAAYLVFLRDEASDLYEQVTKGEHDLAINRIKERYPAKKLHFQTQNISIHDIFSFWISHVRMGDAAAAHSISTRAGSELAYIERASHSFYSEFDKIANYPKLVELAHSIE
ncbi:KAP family P-loop NTPase fold protein [Pseudomonas syringae]|uniref:KAP family P-loop NTPase fold protein n=1 Tax=Pseudomonas syringae TaxID=317 RepID=UPI0002ADC38C|nr:P-loop NTPase fold protein [Pseudomonas syringae]ELS40657.1 KAP P-loop domain protein [Pseudomonas syringae pv. syringae B64]RML32144.1 putative P-loop ATPase [Pseudomonas syringae pv. atrofaciens]